MDLGTRLKSRFVLMAIIAAVTAMVIALPANAYAAKATTRLVAVKSMLVNHDDPAASITWPSAAVRLQKKSGSKWMSLSATVKLYIYNDDDKTYTLLTSKKMSSGSFTLPTRGKYKLYFAGTSTAKAATAYTTLYESIGDSMSMDGSPTVIAVDATYSMVSVKYDVSWNTSAWDGPVMAIFEGQFESSAGQYNSQWSNGVLTDRELFSPRTVEFNYKVKTSDLDPANDYPMASLHSWGSVYVPSGYSPYIVTTATTESSWTYSWPISK
jgi:hypothetical protein